MSKKTVVVSIILTLCLIIEVFVVFRFDKMKEMDTSSVSVNLTSLTYASGNDECSLIVYTQDDFDSFLSDYRLNNLPDIYVTEFLFDGVGMYKTYDLDDFIDERNDIEVKAPSITVLNVNTTGDVEFSGDIVGGMIAVNTNDIDDDINIILNGVNIDTDSKKVPAIFVYNRDISYTDHKVIIKASLGTKNYVEGGKLKKVSLIGSDELNTYSSKYFGEASTWYSTYSNYYGVYTKDEISNVLFATVQADSEDLADGDPYYFYKASGAISSDIDLYFEGEGYLEVTSKNKEGIETKGNLTFSGGVGDYVISALDDCLNTTTKSSVNGSRNDLVIDVNSLTAIVSLDADEGDAIDSNGGLTINGGTIIAVAHPGQDAGLDSESEIIINGGTVIATGDMYDQISSDSTQNFIVLSFNSSIGEDTLVTLLGNSDNVVFAYETDRIYTNLVYSSTKLIDGVYSLYKDGTIVGNNVNGFYDGADSYTQGVRLGYSNIGSQGSMNDENPNNGMVPEVPDNTDSNIPSDMLQTPQDVVPNDGAVIPNKPGNDRNMTGAMQGPKYGGISTKDNAITEFYTQDMAPNDIGGQFNNTNLGSTTNKEFTINGISNLFSGVGEYSE